MQLENGVSAKKSDMTDSVSFRLSSMKGQSGPLGSALSYWPVNGSQYMDKPDLDLSESKAT